MKEKICLKCQTVKPLSDFYKDRTRKYGVQPACKLCSNVYRSNWSNKNRDQISISGKSYRDKNPTKRKQSQSKWNKKNSIKLANYQNQRRTKIKNNGIFQITDKEFNKLYQSNCFYCGIKSKIEIDHVVPINKGGTHSIGNLVAACRSCNASKGSKLLIEWRIALKAS